MRPGRRPAADRLSEAKAEGPTVEAAIGRTCSEAGVHGAAIRGKMPKTQGGRVARAVRPNGPSRPSAPSAVDRVEQVEQAYRSRPGKAQSTRPSKPSALSRLNELSAVDRNRQTRPKAGNPSKRTAVGAAAVPGAAPGNPMPVGGTMRRRSRTEPATHVRLCCAARHRTFRNRALHGASSRRRYDAFLIDRRVNPGIGLFG